VYISEKTSSSEHAQVAAQRWDEVEILFAIVRQQV
jgi:hypothetical protein